MASEFRLPLKKIVQVVPHVHAFYFDRSKNIFDFKPGQYVHIALPIKNPDVRGLSRDFSIASSPTQRDLMVIIKDGPSSFKQTLLNLKLGTLVEFRGPFGEFVLEEKSKLPQILITGGIGVTPFISMTKYAADKNLPLKMKLIASYNKPSEIVYRKEFEELQKKNKNFQYIVTITNPPISWKGLKGKIDKDLVEKHISNLRHCIYYIVGPDSLMTSLYELLIEAGIDEDNIRLEGFPGY